MKDDFYPARKLLPFLDSLLSLSTPWVYKLPTLTFIPNTKKWVPHPLRPTFLSYILRLTNRRKGGFTKSQPLTLHQVLECFPLPKGLRRFCGGGDLHFIACSCYQRILSFRARLSFFCSAQMIGRLCGQSRYCTKSPSLSAGRP